MTTIAIELDHVSKSYQEGDCRRVVFDKMSSLFNRGKVVAIMGRSGSGKTTLLNLMSGIELADEGSVCVLNHDLSLMTETQRTIFRRRYVGFVFQEFNLIPTLSVGENLSLPLELLKKSRCFSQKRVTKLLGHIGLLGRITSFPDRLSGGEQQRIAVARALIHDPALILADEPTGNLDRDTGRSILKLLGTIVRERKKTMVIVTHSEEVAGYCDEIRVLVDGFLTEVS